MTEVQNPNWNIAAVEHYAKSIPLVVPAPPSAGEIPDFSFDIAEPEPPLNLITPRMEIYQPGPSTSLPSPSVSLQLKRTLNPESSNNINTDQTAKRSWKEKKCWKCFKDGCPGGGSKRFCPNPCSSCGHKDCSGKDSRHPSHNCEKLQGK